jgi:DNA-directed RNA polymerase subunit RPC12/RpoP
VIVEPCPDKLAHMDTPAYGGTVGFAEPAEGTRVAFCTACGWSGMPTFLNGVARTACPYCTSRVDLASVAGRWYKSVPAARSKRKAAKAARRRNR